MNYITEIKAFNDLIQLKQLSTGQIVLWYALMYINNKCAWTEWFTVSNLVLQLQTGLSRDGINKGRNVLKQHGIIEFKQNTTKATSYKLNTMSKFIQVDIQNSSQDCIQVDIQNSSQSCSTLNKQNKTKQNKKESKKEKSPTFDDIINSYTENEELRKALKDHLAVRKQKKGALTNRAIELELKELDKLACNESTKTEVVEQSINRGWIGFFPLQTAFTQKGTIDNSGQEEKRAKMIQELQEAIDRGEV